jgi:hypothetical protein
MRTRMGRIGGVLALTLCVGLLPALAAGDDGAVSAAPAAAPAAAPVDVEEQSCLDYTPVEDAEGSAGTAAAGNLGTGDGMTAVAKPGCRACKDRPECTCSYNGQPRVSCVPCCWRTWSGGLICLD